MVFSFDIPEHMDDFGEPISKLQRWLDTEVEIYWTSVISTELFRINIVDKEDAIKFALTWGIQPDAAI